MNKMTIAAVILFLEGVVCACKLPGDAFSSATSASAEPPPRVITISAKEFEFTPGDIVLKVGQPVTLRLTSQDHRHGFNIASLNLRADVNPMQVTEITFTPQKTGSLDFFCDVFCGEGHEEMNGKFTVTD